MLYVEAIIKRGTINKNKELLDVYLELYLIIADLKVLIYKFIAIINTL